MRYVLAILTACSAVAISLGPGCWQTDSWSVNHYPNVRIEVFDSQTAAIIGPRLFRTSDGGESWAVIEYERPEDAIKADEGAEYRKHQVDFVDRERAWRLSSFSHNAVEYSDNGGRSWSRPILVGDGVLGSSLIFISRDKGWVLGEKVVMQTQDGGRHWVEIKSLKGLNLRYPYFLNSSYGWLASEEGTIAYTADGGETWAIERSLPKRVTSIFFITQKQGWAVGEDGVIAYTEDGGRNWLIKPVSLPYEASRKEHTKLLDVFFTSQEVGWISGYDGLILKTTDGGRSWVASATPTKVPLASIRFVNTLRGWAVGGYRESVLPSGKPSNVVIETKDGGETWSLVKFRLE